MTWDMICEDSNATILLLLPAGFSMVEERALSPTQPAIDFAPPGRREVEVGVYQMMAPGGYCPSPMSVSALYK